MINTVFKIKEVVVAYEASGGAGNLDLFTDLPGGAMADRADLALPVTTGGYGNASKTLDLRGTTYRAKFTPNAAGTLEPKEAVLKVERIGLYLDGARGETWQTPDLTFSI